MEHNKIFKIAKKCPILISPFGDYNISGKIAIEADTTSFGMIKIGVSKGAFNLVGICREPYGCSSKESKATVGTCMRLVWLAELQTS